MLVAVYCMQRKKNDRERMMAKRDEMEYGTKNDERISQTK